MGVITIRVKRASKLAGLPGHIGGLGATLPGHIGLLLFCLPTLRRDLNVCIVSGCGSPCSARPGSPVAACIPEVPFRFLRLACPVVVPELLTHAGNEVGDTRGWRRGNTGSGRAAWGRGVSFEWFRPLSLVVSFVDVSSGFSRLQSRPASFPGLAMNSACRADRY